MTNREWLNSLSDKELAEYLASDEFQILKMSFTYTSLGLEKWLQQERIEYNEQSE